MSRKGTIAVISSLIIGMLGLASCGGSALTSPQITTDEHGMYYAAGPMITDTPPSEKEILEWGGYEPGDSIIDEVPEVNWEILNYQSMVSGVNELDLYEVTSKNVETYTQYNGVLDELNLVSEPGQMGFAMFGLRNIPAGEQIKAVRVGGEGSFGADEDDGLYIALGDAANDTYAWSGPYQSGEEWTVVNLMLDSVTDADHAFIVLAVYDGDAAAIYNVEVEIGQPFEFVHPGFEYEIPELYQPGPAPLDEIAPLPGGILDVLAELLLFPGPIGPGF